jgi:plastocyanin
MTRFLLLAALALSASVHAETGAQITIKAFAFGPASLTVPVGTTVVWINQDVEPHTVVSSDQKFQSEALDTGDRFSVTFDKPGSYGYFCSLHPHMTGKVVVK